MEYTHLKHAKTAVFSVRVFTYLEEFFPLKYSSLGGFYTTYQLQLYIKHRNEFLILFFREIIVNICKIDYNKDLENKVIGNIVAKYNKYP